MFSTRYYILKNNKIDNWARPAKRYDIKELKDEAVGQYVKIFTDRIESENEEYCIENIGKKIRNSGLDNEDVIMRTQEGISVKPNNKIFTKVERISKIFIIDVFIKYSESDRIKKKYFNYIEKVKKEKGSPVINRTKIKKDLLKHINLKYCSLSDSEMKITIIDQDTNRLWEEWNLDIDKIRKWEEKYELKDANNVPIDEDRLESLNEFMKNPQGWVSKKINEFNIMTARRFNYKIDIGEDIK